MLFDEDEEVLLYNYCDKKFHGSTAKFRMIKRVKFISGEHDLGNIIFNDIPLIPGSSDEIVVAFANGIGTYVHNPLSFPDTGQVVQELKWLNVDVGCGQ
ncbi:hypothetical protein N9L75_00270 [Porticoccaceae bacterium]|nr:hypothetical protein [Porticoccaceae bacterium]MDA8650996.1 hypothetical protein [Porticoccaceae bacterium]MDB2634600.1 hypothetical protein [Porticoccaceae bacterium]